MSCNVDNNTYDILNTLILYNSYKKIYLLINSTSFEKLIEGQFLKNIFYY